ncbi:MAG: ABC transporter ATP-binding protein [Reyranella sp.]|uniref:ABC transporter ATP-binding protein n=1 Tax=Reyranella sp. TaxID=1929291 RepID=UPI00272FBC92|nr:ABC transporter ATP-binding protein [Reyranella sp.]MDP1964204.1 ABC transporter ATP-binding protein [Reyranella sp.]MDP2372360.1 ABC transporter ATP-binding protein [Reyranella sp.]
MITFEDVFISYPTKFGRKVVIDNLSIVLDTRRSIGVLGLNGSGKSTLLRLIGGSELPQRGRIRRDVSISFPLGYTGCFAGNMSGRENAAFLARVYGYNVAEVVDFVESFAELGEYFDEPVRTYSSGMHSRLGFGASMALKFDVYLIDEGFGAGDARFAARVQETFNNRLKDSRMILVSHQSETMLTYCDAGATLHNGKLTYYDDIKEAVACYNKIVNDPLQSLRGVS